MKKLYRRFLTRLVNTALWRWILLKVVPYIRFSVYYTKLRGVQYHKGYRKLRPGDIILSTDNRKLTTFIIPGMFTHASLCVSLDTKFEVAEMTHLGYTESCFFDICKEADRVVILRCRDWDSEYTAKVIEACKNLDGTPYDTAFNLGVSELYCSELVYESDIERRLDVDLSDVHGLGTKYISPDGLYLAINTMIVWDSEDD